MDNLTQASSSVGQSPITDNTSNLPYEVEIDTSKLISWVWKGYKKFKKRLSDGTYKIMARCNTCGVDKPCGSSTSGTTSLGSHLFVCKGSPWFKEKKDNADSSQPSIKFDKGTGEVKKHEFDQKRGEMMIYRYVIKDEQPFRAVEGEGFQELIYDLCPRFMIPKRKKVAAGVMNLYLEEKEKLKNIMSGSRVSLTTDTWTSIQNINYMVVTTHFLDDDWKLLKKIISFEQITSHKGEDIGRSMERVLNDWGIEKIFSITVDNASTNEGAVEYVSKMLKDMNTLLIDGEMLHLRCTCHIINLIVKDGLKELNKSIEGIRNCVKFIHSSSSRLATFRDFCKLMKLGDMCNIPLDVVTRWNSTYKMLVSALKYIKVFERMMRECCVFQSYFNESSKIGDVSIKRVGPPSEEDWDMASGFAHFLEMFYSLTVLFSKTKTCTSHRIFYEISRLQRAIEKKCEDNPREVVDPKLKAAALKMKPKFDKYWGSFNDVNKLIFIANVLDPRYKFDAIKSVYKNLGPNRVEEIINEVKTCLLNLYYAYKEDKVVEQPREDHIDIEIENRGDDDDLFLDIMSSRVERNTTVDSNEVERYLMEVCESIKDKNFDPLMFWRSSNQRFPILSRVAKDVFAIPSSTVASESAFSLGGRVVDPFRTNLTPKMVEALVCASDWLKAPFDFYKEPTDDELELYKECEAIESSNGAAH